MESKTESAYFYSRTFRFATHYPVRFLLYPRLSSFVPLGAGFSFPVPRLREGVPKVKAPKRRRERIKRPASEETARLAAHQGWESCCRDGAFGLLPRPLGAGFQRERAAALALRVVGGPGRSRNALVLFFRGVGRVLFQKRMRPTSLRWEPPLAGVREMWGTFQWAKPIEKNCTAICSISASAHTAAPLPQWVSAYPAGSGGWRPALRPRSWRPARPDRSLSGWPRTVRRFRPPAPSE